jgi:hypothetical protein
LVIIIKNTVVNCSDNTNFILSLYTLFLCLPAFAAGIKQCV